MLRLFFTAMLASLLCVSSQAQTVRGGDTSGYLLGSSQGSALEFNPGFPPTYPPSSDTFIFNPDPDLRQGVTRSILAGVERRTPALAASLGDRPFDTFGPALTSHGISESRLDDALAFMMLALWDAANASSAETTPRQTTAVKRQAQGILASLPRGRPVEISVQEASDSIYLTALVFSILTSKVLEDRNPSSVAQLQRAASQESLASFGVDFRGLSLTDAGLSRR